MPPKKKSTKKTPSKEVKAAVDTVAEATSAKEDPTSNSINLEDLKTGYVTGVTKEGQLVFQLFGARVGLIEVLGVHEFASRRVAQAYDQQQMTGDRLVNEIGRAVAALTQRFDGVFGAKETAATEETVAAPVVTAE